MNGFRIVSFPAEIRIENLPNTRLERYRYTNLLSYLPVGTENLPSELIKDKGSRTEIRTCGLQIIKQRDTHWTTTFRYPDYKS
jgi:hypothetical protein